MWFGLEFRLAKVKANDWFRVRARSRARARVGGLGPCLGLVSGVKLVFDLDVKLLCVRVKVMCRVGPGLDYGCG